jgi:hypothetical protein
LITESDRRSQDHIANKKLDQDIESIFSDDPDVYQVSTISGRIVSNNNDNNNDNDIDHDVTHEAEQRRPNGKERFRSKPWNSMDDHQVTMVAENANGEGQGRATMMDQHRFGGNVQNGYKDRGIYKKSLTDRSCFQIRQVIKI